MPLDLIAKLREAAAEGSKADRAVARAMLSDLEQACRASIAELAAAAGVSEPSVTRFCRELGCDGVRDFKMQLVQVLAVGGLYLYPQPLDRSESARRIVNAVSEGAHAAVDAAAKAADMSKVEQVAGLLTQAKRIYVYGSGGVSSLGAIELQNRLFRLGLAVVAHTDGQMQRMTASVANSDCVIVAISSSGRAPSALEATKIARQYGASTVALSAPDSPLGEVVDVCLPAPFPGDDQLYKPTSGRYALLIVVDLIAMAAAETLGPDVLEGLRRIRTSLSSLNRGDPTRPIGD
ncbi:MurR/RpiR family transcriptional regulator [Rhodovibrio salinarum]|uniref:MurR/RpiR family transcriptional regulator n=1 Tax=Rhodovibrio salinarum TaxID=1087 RepID=A0A934UZC9_9PROT|nr:MurR/RpiR family transcriptional regulator [Rhodovibrio salinarum]MBK1696598.1 MurR/RpiR family transcriptional regulator [Rhodovibrio salinarum]